MSVDVDTMKEKEREFQVRITESMIELKKMKDQFKSDLNQFATNVR